MSRTEDVPSHLHGECDDCGSDLDENGSNMTIISTSSGDTVTVRCDDCEARHHNHIGEVTGYLWKNTMQ